MFTNDGPGVSQAAQFAGLVFAHREAVLDAWCSLLELDNDEPAAPFIRDQLDASVLALASWFLGEDPAESTMSMQWAGIQPGQEFTTGAIVSMSLLPEAVRTALAPQPDVPLHELTKAVSGFTAEMTCRLWTAGNVHVDEERWNTISREVEERYEAQRLQRVRRLSVLIEIAHAVSTSQDLDSLFEQVRRATVRLSGSDYTEISLLDQRLGLLRCHLVHSDGKRQPQLENTLIRIGLANEVLERGTELVVSDYSSACSERGIPPSTAIDDEQQRAWMAAPMRQGDQIVGVIAVSSPMTSFEQEDVELLAAIARQTAVALENRRLIEAQQRHVAQLSAVNHLARRTSDLRDPVELLTTASRLIHEHFASGLVTIFQADPEETSLRMVARTPVGVERETIANLISIELGTIVGEVAISRQPVRHDDVLAGITHLSTPSTESTRSEMAVPIVYSDRLLGILDVQSPDIGAYDEYDLKTLQTIADQIGIGLENSRLFGDEAQRTRELRLMLLTTRAASSSLQLDEVLERLAEGIAEAAGTSDCLIHLFDSEERFFRPAVLVGSDNGEIPMAFQDWNRILSVENRADLLQALNDPYPVMICPVSDRSSVTGQNTATLLVPLRTRQRTLGMAVVNITVDCEQRYPMNQMRLIQGVADSAALAVENARLYARAHGLAIAEERGRLAQEIHDTLAQGLTAISLQLDLADSYLPDKPEQAAKNVHRALELSRSNLDEARRSVLDLQAAGVHQMSLPDAISQLLRRLSDDADITYEFASDGLSTRLSARIEVGLYRILEEALENARRHSNAHHVRVTLRADGSTVAVVIEDDGCGFDPGCLQGHDTGRDAGYGLVGIRERARLLGGSLTISSSPGCGTTLRVTVPYEARQLSAQATDVDQGERA